VPHFSDEFKRELADATSIVDLVSRYVKLNRKGADWWGCCPFHNEKSPSFKVNEVRKAYKCFGCGEGGDAYKFVMQVEGLGFVEAVKELAERAGIPLPQEDLDPQEAARAKHRDALNHATELACKWFEQVLWSDDGAAGRAELERREVDPELARKFRLGLVPDAWDGLGGHLHRKGIPAAIAEEAGLVLRRRSGDGYYDRFRNRLMFPISTAGGKVVAFGGRTLGDDDAKYINSPESPIYSKSGALYGLHQARASIHKEDRVLVVEGYFDVLGLAKAGLGFAVAPCGTALTDRQLGILRRHTRNLVMLFDADSAGQRAAFKALEIAVEQGVWPTWLSVPDGKDPDDFVRENGADAMRQLMEQQRPLLDVWLESRFEHAGDNPIARDEALGDIAPMLKELAPTLRTHYSRQVAGAFDLDPRVVDERVTRAKRRTRRPSAPPVARRAPRPDPVGGPPAAPDFGPPPDFDDGFGGAPPGPPPDFPPHPGDAPAPPRARSTAAQRQLLRLLVQDLPNVAHAVDDMGAISWIGSPAVELVAGRLMRSWREGRTPTAMELLPEVEDNEVVRDISEVLTSEERWYPPDVLRKATQECLIRLRLEWIESRRSRSARELSSLQRRGSIEPGLMAELAQQCVDLDKERDALQAHLSSVL